MWDNLSAEKVKEIVEQKLAGEELKAEQAQSIQDERDFVAAHPTFKNIPAN